MAVISAYAQRKKLEYFFSKIPKEARILEVGCADGWVGEYALKHGWVNFVGVDIVKPENTNFGHDFIHGDINKWQDLGLEGGSFDAIIAFEVIEHGDFFEAFHDLLKPEGLLIYTTPVPHMDWACNILEKIGLNQRRTSEHTHLIYSRDIPKFNKVETKVKGFISQWGVLQKRTENESLA